MMQRYETVERAPGKEWRWEIMDGRGMVLRQAIDTLIEQVAKRADALERDIGNLQVELHHLREIKGLLESCKGSVGPLVSHLAIMGYLSMTGKAD